MVSVLEWIPALETATAWHLAAVAVIIFCAALIHGVLGLGFPLVATPLLAMLTDVRTAMLVLLIPTVCINVASILSIGQWRQKIVAFWPLALFGGLGSIVGTYLLVITNPSPYKLLLAASIVLYLNMHRMGLRLSWLARHLWIAMAVFGLVAGLLAGTVNVMVPALVVFALEMKLAPKTMVQVFNFCFLVGKLSQMATFTASGLFTTASLLTSLPVALVALLALLGGFRLRHRVDAEAYRRGLRILLAVIALMLVVQFFLGR